MNECRFHVWPLSNGSHFFCRIVGWCTVNRGVWGLTDMPQLHAALKAQGVKVEADVRPAWGAQGYGDQFKLWDPEGNKIELRCYMTPRQV